MKSRRAIAIGALLLATSFPVALAEPVDPRAAESSSEVGLPGYERHLEESLTRALTAYLGEGQHIVQVKALISGKGEGVQPAVVPVEPPAMPLDQPPVLPGLPPEVRLEPPAVPQQAPVQQAVAPLQRRIESLRVSLVLPSSASDQDEDFARRLVMQKVDHQLVRDVQMDVSRRDFRANPIQPLSAPATTGDAQPSWVWLALAAGAGLGIGLLLLLLRPKQVSAPVQSAVAVPPSPQPEMPVAKPAGPKPVDYRHELVILLLTEPEHGERYLMQLLGADMGLDRAALLVKALGSGVSRRLFPGVPVEVWRQIELKQLERMDATAEEVEQALQETYRNLLRERNQPTPTTFQRHAPFAFLDTLDDSQLIFILQDETPKVQALVLSQLPPARSVGLMRLFTPSEVGAIAAGMGDIQSMPLPALGDIASHLAEKATDAPVFSTTLTNGLEYLVNMLDHSDQLMEQRIFQELSTQNPQLLQQVRQNYLSFTDLPGVPVNVLRDAVRDFPKEQLAELLRDAPEEITQVLLGALNERGRMLVEEALKGPALLDVEPAAREDLRRQFLVKVRQLMKVAVRPQGGR